MNDLDEAEAEKLFNAGNEADEAEAEKLFEAGGKTVPEQKLTEDHGIQRLELHKVAPDTSDAEPATSKDDDLLSQVAKYLTPKSGTGAFAEGVSKGGTLGFGDEVYGALDADARGNEQRARVANDVAEAKRRGTYDPSAGAPELPSFATYQLKRPGEDTQTVVRAAKSPNETQEAGPEAWTKAYRQARDSMRSDYDTAEGAHPVLFGAGELAGAAALPLPGPGKARGLAKAGKYALQGLGVGAAAGLGNSTSDVTEGNVGGALLDMAAGGAGGFVLGGTLGYGASKLDPVLERAAFRRAYKALDPHMKTMQANLREQLGRDASPAEVMAEVERLGKRTLDENVIPQGKLGRWANSETLGNRAAAAREEAGALKGGFTQMAQDQLGGQPVRAVELARSIDSQAQQAAQSPASQQLSRALQREAEGVRSAAENRALAGQSINYTLPEAERLKTALQKGVYGLDVARRGGPTQQAKEAVASLARQQVENAIEKGLGPDDLEQFQALKGKYGDLAKIAETAGHGALRSFRNNEVGLGDKLAAQVGAHAASGGASIPAAIAAGAAHNVVNNRGSAALARTLSNAAQSSDLLAPVVATPWSSFLHSDDEEQK